jgi:excisionase family DNA binding protein
MEKLYVTPEAHAGSENLRESKQNERLNRRLYSVKETLGLLGIGRTMLYRLMSEQKLEARKLGRRTLIPAEQIERLLASLPKL